MHRLRHLSFEDLFHAMPNHVVLVGPELEVIHANQVVREQFGEPAGRSCFAMFKARTSPCEDCPAEATFQDGRPRRFESTLSTPDGRELRLLVMTHPVLDDDGKVVAILEVSTDVTELKRLQLAVEQERDLRRDDLRRVHRLFNEVPCYVSVVDEDYSIRETNRLFKETFGEAPGAKCYELFKRRQSPCEECPVAQTFRDGLPHSSETTIRSSSGRPINVAVRSAPIGGRSGRVRRVMEMAVDVTEIKDLQRDLARLGKMAAHAAHNIKGILTGLRGGIFMVNEGRKRGDDPVATRGWQMVQNNVERIATQSLDILSFAKRRVPKVRPVELARLFEDALEGVLPRTREKGLRLESSIGPGADVAQADPALLAQVLTVLVDNAVDAALEDASRSAHTVRIASSREDAVLRIDVSDDGCGIDEDAQARIFEDFYSTKGSMGTGLGLVTSHKIVEEHGGSLEFVSKPGAGTTFTVRLPTRDAAGESGGEEAPAQGVE